MSDLPKDVIRYLQGRGIWGRIYVPVPDQVKRKQARRDLVREMAANGVSKTTIAERLNLSRTTVYRYLNESE